MINGTSILILLHHCCSRRSLWKMVVFRHFI